MKLEFKNTERQPLKKAIKSTYPQISDLKISNLLKEREIRVDGNKIARNYVVEKDSIIEIFISEKAFKKNELEIIYKDENVLVINKPIKIETTSLNDNVLTLERLVKEAYPTAKALHRLDINTSGLVIFSLNDIAEKCLFEGFKNRNINKYYMAVVMGKDIKENETFTDYIQKDEKTSIVKVFSEKKKPKKLEVKTAILSYETVERKGPYAVLKIELKTGRTHQIRAQLAHHKIFILGDGKYGDKKINRIGKIRRQMLSAYKLSFDFPESAPLVYLNSHTFQITPNFHLKKED